jgi:hypothetical protein
MRDFLGVEIHVGSRVVWPAQSGHRVTMRRGEVVKLNATGSITVRPAGHNYHIAIRRVDNVVVVF